MPLIFKRRISKTTLAIAGGLIAAGVVGIIIGSVHLSSTSKNTTSTDSTQVSNTPPFNALLPEGKSIESLGGWQKLTPPESEPTYVFLDSVDGVTVNVSQQTLPNSLKGNTESGIAAVAKGYNADRTLDTGATSAYIGNSVKGPQSIIFSKNGILVLIVSESQLDDARWVTYLESLR